LAENLGFTIFKNAPEPGGKIAAFGPKQNGSALLFSREIKT
jgi:hypothetical protein